MGGGHRWVPVGLWLVWGCQLGPHGPYISRGGGSAPLSCPSVPGEVGGTCHSPPGGWGHCGSRLWVQGRLVPAALGTRGAPSWQPGPLPSGIYLLPQIPPAAGGCPGCVGGGVPLPTAHSAAALLLGGVGDPWSHPKNAHRGLWGHHRSAPSPKTRGLVLWGGGAAPPKAGVWLPVLPPPQILGIPKLLEPGEPTGCLGNCGQDGEVQGSGWHGDGESRCLGDGTHPSCTQGCWGGPALRPAGPGGVLGVLAARRKTGG